MALVRKWRIAPPITPHQASRFPELPPVLAQILHNRGIRSSTEASEFLAQSHETKLSDPWSLPDMEAAVARIREALEGEEQIAVFGDYDVDGVSAAAILAETFAALGGRGRGRIKIPARSDEGYGLNRRDLKALADTGCTLVVTVDCGTRSVAEIEYARDELGMDVVVTDHHRPLGTLPPAVAVVNPKRADSQVPFRQLAGAGVAFKLAQALASSSSFEFQPEGLLDLVALGTVADLVPLQDENRVLAQRGIELLNRSNRRGLRALMERAGVRSGEIDAVTIGYVLGPRLNAAGRMADAGWSVRLLMSETEEEARAWASRLEQANRERRRATEEAFGEARREVAETAEEDRLLFVAGERYPSGIAGLVASRLVEEFHRPAVVAERGPETTRGSARSIPGFHITRALDGCGDLMIKHGGHAMAAGFTVANENLADLERSLKDGAAEAIGEDDLAPVLEVDAELRLDQIASEDVPSILSLLEPYGSGNSEPIFVSRGAEVREARPVGREGAHLKFALADRGALWDGIAFRLGDRVAEVPIGARIDLAYHVSRDRWNGRERVQLRVRDFKSSESAP